MTPTFILRGRGRGFSLFVLAGLTAAFAGLTVGCGAGADSPRGAYDALRAAYQSGDYARMVDLLHLNSRATLEAAAPSGERTAEAGLRRLLPPRRELQSLVDAVLSENPEALEAIERADRSEFFYRLRAASNVARRKGQRGSEAERQLAQQRVRFVLVFTIPSDEIGARLQPSGNTVEFNLDTERVTFQTSQDSAGTMRFLWPR